MKRQTQGDYYNLVQELKLGDRVLFQVSLLVLKWKYCNVYVKFTTFHVVYNNLGD